MRYDLQGIQQRAKMLKVGFSVIYTQREPRAIRGSHSGKSLERGSCCIVDSIIPGTYFLIDIKAANLPSLRSITPVSSVLS